VKRSVFKRCNYTYLNLEIKNRRKYFFQKN